MVWRGPWLGIEPGTSRTQNPNSPTDLYNYWEKILTIIRIIRLIVSTSWPQSLTKIQHCQILVFTKSFKPSTTFFETFNIQSIWRQNLGAQWDWKKQGFIELHASKGINSLSNYHKAECEITEPTYFKHLNRFTILQFEIIKHRCKHLLKYKYKWQHLAIYKLSHLRHHG